MSIKVKIPESEITITEDELNFNRLEQKIWGWEMQQGCAILEKVLEEIDSQLKEKREEGLKNKGFRQKYLSTRFGSILYRRRAYYSSERKFRCILDERIGLQKAQKVSTSRSKLESSLSFIRSYRGVEDIFQFILGTSRSFEAIRQQVLKTGKELEREQEKEANDLFEGKGLPGDPGEWREFAMLEADETFIALQGESKKKAGVKLGIGYDGWGRRYQKGKGKSFGLLRKFVYTGIEEGERFAEKLSLFADRRMKLERVKHLIVGGDGAAWISETLLGYFTNAVYQLCKFHLNRAIKRSLAFSESLQKKVRESLRASKTDEALNLLRKEAITRRGKIGEKIRELMVYIKNNRHGINGIKNLKKKLSKEEREKLRSTGAIEGNIDKTICNRFKKRGMRWSIFGANCLLKVGEKIMNGEWENWWSQVKGFHPEPIKVIPADTEKKKYRILLGGTREEFWGDYLERGVPAMHGPAQNRAWVDWMKKQIQLVPI